MNTLEADIYKVCKQFNTAVWVPDVLFQLEMIYNANTRFKYSPITEYSRGWEQGIIYQATETLKRDIRPAGLVEALVKLVEVE